jgi:Fur family transcriptional regulator, ferric uptake regulator
MERNTRQRTAIREAIAQAGRPLLPQEVLDAAQAAAPGLSIATVYRNLRALLDEGELRSVMLPGENARYELAGIGHHHHFQCLQCQRVFEVTACPGNLAALAPPGFTVEDHDLTLYGRCSDCGVPRAARPPARARGSAGHQPGPAQDQPHDHTHGQTHDHTHGHTRRHGPQPAQGVTHTAAPPPAVRRVRPKPA